MSALQNIIYVFDSRQRNVGGSINDATYSMTAAGGLQAGTYEMLSYHSTNNFYNVEAGVNDQITFDEDPSTGSIGTLTPGYYSASDLATEIDVAMDAAAQDGNTFATSYSTATGKFTTVADTTDYNFTWLTGGGSGLANEIMGYSLVDTVGAVATHTSDGQFTPALHSMLIIDISEDSQQNVTLVSTGAEHSLIVPLVSDYQEEIDSLKQNVFSQNINFSAVFNSVNVKLFTEDGVAPANPTDYELTLRRIF